MKNKTIRRLANCGVILGSILAISGVAGMKYNDNIHSTIKEQYPIRRYEELLNEARPIMKSCMKEYVIYNERMSCFKQSGTLDEQIDELTRLESFKKQEKKIENAKNSYFNYADLALFGVSLNLSVISFAVAMGNIRREENKSDLEKSVQD